jgi:hypothetical protein
MQFAWANRAVSLRDWVRAGETVDSPVTVGEADDFGRISLTVGLLSRPL